MYYDPLMELEMSLQFRLPKFDKMPNFNSFEEFWPWYVSKHRNRTSRVLHFIGSSLAGVALAIALLGTPCWLLAMCLLGAKLSSPWWYAMVPAFGYSFAWSGHLFFEHNMPASFSAPFWSLHGDGRMYYSILTGRMAAELEKSAKQYPPAR